jgi:hypothetical protein
MTGQLDRGLGRTLREIDTPSRIARDFGLARNRFQDVLMGRPDLSSTGRALVETRQRINIIGGLDGLADRATRASAGLEAAGGIETIMRRHTEMERVIAELSGLGRKVLRSVHEGARDLARDLSLTDAYLTSRRERKKVEMLFAHLKRILKLDRLRLRGPNGAKDEFLLAATAQNLRKMAKLLPSGATAMAG